MSYEVGLTFNNALNISPFVSGIKNLSGIQFEPIMAEKLIFLLNVVQIINVVSKSADVRLLQRCTGRMLSYQGILPQS